MNERPNPPDRNSKIDRRDRRYWIDGDPTEVLKVLLKDDR